MFVFEYEDDYAGLAAHLEQRFLGYLEPTHTPDPPLGHIAEAYPYFPHYFPGNWPVLGVSELPPIPGLPGVSDTSLRIERVRVGLRIYAPSLTRQSLGEEFADGREAAKRISRAAFSTWLEQFSNDDDLESRCSGGTPSIEAIDMGDSDKVGSPFWLPSREGLTRLWVHAWEAHVPL